MSLSMVIGLADALIDGDPAEAHRLLAEARESSRLALVELRHLVRGIHPPVLAEPLYARELLGTPCGGVGYLLKDRVANIFTKLDMPPSDDSNRRVLAVLAYLNT